MKTCNSLFILLYKTLCGLLCCCKVVILLLSNTLSRSKCKSEVCLLNTGMKLENFSGLKIFVDINFRLSLYWFISTREGKKNSKIFWNHEQKEERSDQMYMDMFIHQLQVTQFTVSVSKLSPVHDVNQNLILNSLFLSWDLNRQWQPWTKHQPCKHFTTSGHCYMCFSPSSRASMDTFQSALSASTSSLHQPKYIVKMQLTGR